MFELIKARDDLFAIRVSGKITGDDLDAIMNQLETHMAAPGKVHVFVETDSIDGIEIAGLASYSARALPLFGKLGRFGRVAVVANQAWIRLATRLESALLPGISYRTYLPEEREKALAWAMGTSDE